MGENIPRARWLLVTFSLVHVHFDRESPKRLTFLSTIEAFPTMRKIFFTLIGILSTGTALVHVNKSPLLKTSHPQRFTTIRRLPQCQASSDRESESVSIIVEGFTTRNRALMAGVAIAGATETAILTYSKVTNTPIASVVGDLCTSREACTHVLDGPYATIPFLNVPLSALGCVAYTTVALLAIAPTLGNIITTTTNNSNTNTNSNSYSNSNKDQTATSTSSHGNDDANARQLLLLLTSGMAAFSVYLMVVLGVVVQETCVFCYTRYTPLLLLSTNYHFLIYFKTLIINQHSSSHILPLL